MKIKCSWGDLSKYRNELFGLSGMGLYFSLIRNDSVKRFYIRRFKRILPTFLIASVMYYFWLNFVYRYTMILGFVHG